MTDEKNLLPKDIIQELDKFIVGQRDAKRAVAIALRNRWRRMQLPLELRKEIAPKNILMIGPTGVGKTEIARRLAHLVEAPFIKVEATKFTEVGYVGRDVESIVRDLVEVAVKMVREQARVKMKTRVDRIVEERLLDLLLTKGRRNSDEEDGETPARKAFREKLHKGELDDREIEVPIRKNPMGVEIMGPPGMEEVSSQIQSMFKKAMGSGKTRKRMKLADARRILTDEVADEELNEEEINTKAVELVEQHSIVFLDEMDKITRGSDERGYRGVDASREGVQRDLLPIIEGSTVRTRYGTVKTDHILFIGSGAFHLATPSDMIPELQGRLPIRVNLSSLSPEDMERILTEPDNSLTLQYGELLRTEGLHIEFSKEAVKRLAYIAWQVNENVENIGARRLHTIMEKLLEDISFTAKELASKYTKDKPLVVDEAKVNESLAELLENKDLTRYVL